MHDAMFLILLLACLVLTFGLVRLCSALMPHDSSSPTGSNP